MAGSYSAATLATTPKDQVRLLIQDTVDPFAMQDEELVFRLAANGGALFATASDICMALAARFAQEVDLTGEAGDSVLRSQKAKSYQALADRYAQRSRELGEAANAAAQAAQQASTTVPGLPWFGGSLADIDAAERDTSRVPDPFSRLDGLRGGLYGYRPGSRSRGGC